MAMKTPFASTESCLYVKLKYSGIHFLVASCDGLPLIRFGNEKTLYIKVSDAINWHEKELKETRGQSGSEETLSSLRKAMTFFEEGKVQA